jgi:hypothetical protein
MARRIVDAGDDAHGRSLRRRKQAENARRYGRGHSHAGRDRPLGGGRAERPFSCSRQGQWNHIGPVPTSTRLSPCPASLVWSGLQFHWLYV